MEHRRILHSCYHFVMSFHSFRCAPLVKMHKFYITRGRSTGLPYQRMEEPISLFWIGTLSSFRWEWHLCRSIGVGMRQILHTRWYTEFGRAALFHLRLSRSSCYMLILRSPCDNKSVSQWITFDYFFHVWKVNICFLFSYVHHLFLLTCVKFHGKKFDNNDTLTHICLLPFFQMASYDVT